MFDAMKYYLISILSLSLLISCELTEPKRYAEFIIRNEYSKDILEVEILRIDEIKNQSFGDTLSIMKLDTLITPGQSTNVLRYHYRGFSMSGNGTILAKMIISNESEPLIKQVGKYSNFKNDAHNDSTPSDWNTYEIFLSRKGDLGVLLSHFEEGKKLEL